MRKILALALALCMVFALAACGSSGSAPEAPAAAEAPARSSAAEAPAAPAVAEAPAVEAPAAEAPAAETPSPDGDGLVLCNAKGEVIALVPMEDVTILDISEAGVLTEEQQAEFRADYDYAYSLTDRTVVRVFWFDLPEEYKTDDFAFAVYPFDCEETVISVTDRRNEMRFCRTDRSFYVTELDDFGTVAIFKAPAGEGGTVEYGSPTVTVSLAVPTMDQIGVELFDAQDRLIASVPWEEAVVVSIEDADQLGSDEQELFQAAFERARTTRDSVVRYFFWLDVPETYKTENFAYAVFRFPCEGVVVGADVNGENAPVSNLGNGYHTARLPQFGAVTVNRAL